MDRISTDSLRLEFMKREVQVEELVNFLLEHIQTLYKELDRRESEWNISQPITNSESSSENLNEVTI